MPSRLILWCLLCALSQVRGYSDGNTGAIRFAHYEVLAQQYAAEASQTRGANEAEPPIVKDDAARMRLCHDFTPKFLALALEDPDDEAAVRCCEWVIAHCRSHSSDRHLYQAESVAWEIIQKSCTASDRLPAICLEAARYPSPAREQFLRALPENYRQPVEVHGYAYLALAELLAKKVELKSTLVNLDDQIPADQRDYLATIDCARLNRESAELYQHVLAHYGDVPYTPGTQSEHECRTLGQLAAKRLGELDGQQFARKASPNVIEMPDQRFDHLSGN